MKEPINKRQKKIYLHENAAWYLARMQTETGKTQGEIVDSLVIAEAERRGLPKPKDK